MRISIYHVTVKTHFFYTKCSRFAFDWNTKRREAENYPLLENGEIMAETLKRCITWTIMALVKGISCKRWTWNGCTWLSLANICRPRTESEVFAVILVQRVFPNPNFGQKTLYLKKFWKLRYLKAPESHWIDATLLRRLQDFASWGKTCKQTRRSY